MFGRGGWLCCQYVHGVARTYECDMHARWGVRALTKEAAAGVGSYGRRAAPMRVKRHRRRCHGHAPLPHALVHTVRRLAPTAPVSDTLLDVLWILSCGQPRVLVR